ncbi:hypothetical protein NBT05_02625 [Aquimarina sp. ERC-38]|uniref:hypothetical protein n=1 Tax=Aquimarina sp. ERC-38 TaxID=2949996 RepID=UPI002247BA9F|nr:hypothetical protein [Aquimarina sp. ERC-38]UZO81377.1 hypothetical protein NBT05_02625 [Aquimarina sp. ERC-38]
MKTPITVQIEVKNQAEAKRVQKALETINRNFGAKGIIKMEQLFLTDAFIRNLVKMKLA